MKVGLIAAGEKARARSRGWGDPAMDDVLGAA
jgi:hypothetical protein